MLSSLTFVISAGNHQDVLARTVMLLHRLAIPILGLTMKRPKQWRRMSLILEVDAPAEQAERIAAQLLKTVHVVSVTRKPHHQPVPHAPKRSKP